MDKESNCDMHFMEILLALLSMDENYDHSLNQDILFIPSARTKVWDGNRTAAYLFKDYVTCW